MSDLLHVRGLQSFGSVHNLEFHRIALSQRSESIRRDGGVVHKNILAAVLRNETETLRIVEPLNCTLRHCDDLMCWEPGGSGKIQQVGVIIIHRPAVPQSKKFRPPADLSISGAELKLGAMATPGTLTVRTFLDRTEGLAHLIQRADQAPRLLAFDDVAGCPVETALAALEWTEAVGLLPDDDLLHAARLTSETAAAVVERKAAEGGKQFVYLGPRLDAPPMDVFEGRVLFDEPGVKAVEFSQRAHALAHFLRATSGTGALMALLSRRAPEIRHLRRWFRPIVQALGTEHLLIGGWFAASSAGALFGSLGDEESFRYIEVGTES